MNLVAMYLDWECSVLNLMLSCTCTERLVWIPCCYVHGLIGSCFESHSVKYKVSDFFVLNLMLLCTWTERIPLWISCCYAQGLRGFRFESHVATSVQGLRGFRFGPHFAMYMNWECSILNLMLLCTCTERTPFWMTCCHVHGLRGFRFESHDAMTERVLFWSSCCYVYRLWNFIHTKQKQISNIVSFKWHVFRYIMLTLVHV